MKKIETKEDTETDETAMIDRKNGKNRWGYRNWRI